jgi:hypothetical protein
MVAAGTSSSSVLSNERKRHQSRGAGFPYQQWRARERLQLAPLYNALKIQFVIQHVGGIAGGVMRHSSLRVGRYTAK